MQVFIVGTEIALWIELGHGQGHRLAGSGRMNIEPRIGRYAAVVPAHKITLAKAPHLATETGAI